MYYYTAEELKIIDKKRDLQNIINSQLSGILSQSPGKFATDHALIRANAPQQLEELKTTFKQQILNFKYLSNLMTRKWLCYQTYDLIIYEVRG